MPTIPATTFADGAAIAAATFQDAVYLPDTTTPESYEVINGWLQTANMDGSFSIERRMVQRRQLVEARQVGSSMPLDYFSDLFNGQAYSANGVATSDALDSFVAIPGANIPIYVGDTDPAMLMVTWSISWESDLYAAGASPIRFAIGGAPKSAGNRYRRVVPRTVFGASNTHRDCRIGNHWTGFYVLSSSEYANNAWNDVGLMIASSAPQVRVRNRRIGYIMFR